MSASLALPMAGPPETSFSPTGLAELTATGFPDHMKLDRSIGANVNNNNNKDEQHHDRQGSRSEMQEPDTTRSHNTINSRKERTRALGNLLGALMPIHNEENEHRANAGVEEVGQVDVPDHHEVSAQAQPEAQPEAHAEVHQPLLPPFDTTVSDAISTDANFLQLDAKLDPDHIIRQTGPATVGDDMSKTPAVPQQREFEAFARLQFEDGSYYLNTFQCELGRDVLAYRASLWKEKEQKEQRQAELDSKSKSHSSSGRVSHPSGSVKRQIGGQAVPGSVVSERGGFVGIDDGPPRQSQAAPIPTESSQPSEVVVNPLEYFIDQHAIHHPYDYYPFTDRQPLLVPNEDYGKPIFKDEDVTATGDAAAAANDDNDDNDDEEEPAAVTAAHLPNPHLCPLIPIHGKPVEGQTDAELHRKISRRHVKIRWNFPNDRWEMRVLGRNGAFCDGVFVRRQQVMGLRDGAIIQIAHVVLTFHLPKQPQSPPETRQAILRTDADEVLHSIETGLLKDTAEDVKRESMTKINLKIGQKTDQSPPDLAPLGPDGLPIVKRRGPGRPPKDGIMSTRERKEREKAAKAAAAREANGGKTPPPTAKGRILKPSPPTVEEAKVETKPEKRKYTKRKAVDENGNPVAEGEGDADDGDAASDGEPKAKKVRVAREKSASPEYPPKEALTAEQLARPPESYAQLLYKILLELYPRALPLKEIYRELKRRYPWFVHEATTEGWQSSVRHNLNSEFGKLFEKGEKEGKGFAWRANPNAQLPHSEKKRTTQATTQKPRPPAMKPSFPSLSGHNVQWQATGAFPTDGSQPSFVNHTPWVPQQGQPGSDWSAASGFSQSGTHPLSMPANPGMPQRPMSEGMPSSSQTQMGQSSGVGHDLVAATAAAPAVQPAPTTSSSAASNMPCLLDGIEAIKRFEKEMYKQLHVDHDGSSDGKGEFWVHVFSSAKKRVLHGFPNSTVPRGHTKEEETIMRHMQLFVNKWANPAFKGFKTKIPTSSSTDEAATPASGPASNGTPAPISASALVPALTAQVASDGEVVGSATAANEIQSDGEVVGSATATNEIQSDGEVVDSATAKNEIESTDVVPIHEV